VSLGNVDLADDVPINGALTEGEASDFTGAYAADGYTVQAETNIYYPPNNDDLNPYVNINAQFSVGSTITNFLPDYTNPAPGFSLTNPITSEFFSTVNEIDIANYSAVAPGASGDQLALIIESATVAGGELSNTPEPGSALTALIGITVIGLLRRRGPSPKPPE
jgi:hypothetical protein